MQNEKERLFRFFQNKGKINAIKAEEIANILMKKRLKKNELFLEEGHVNNEYLILEYGFMWAFSFDVTGLEVTTVFYSGNH